MITEFGWLAVAALAVPILLIALVPRRWLGRTILAWAFLPLIVYVSVIAWEGMTRPETEISLQNALLGFSLISAIFIIPWAIACAAGFAIGLGLRWLIRGAKGVKAPREPDQPSPASPATVAPHMPDTLSATQASDSSSDAAEWRQVHIGFSNDGLKIGGLDVWMHAWRSVDTAPLRLAHPAHPDEEHRFTVQEIEDGSIVARFAVSELSNGVWGFYVPRQYHTDVGALSADGSLRYGQRTGDNAAPPSDSPESWAVLIDTATQRALVDCAAWPASRITGNADGSLFLRLQQDDGETLFRIDPVARTFRNQGENGSDRPLLELADAVERLRQTRAHRPPGPHYRRISPDGTIRIETEAVEWGNSHWVQTPRVIDIASGRVVLDLWNTDWDATISYPGNRRVALDFQRYHFSGDLAIELDLANDAYHITREPGGGAELPSGPLDEAANAMEASGRRVAAFAASHNNSRPIWEAESKPSPIAAWRTALAILLVAAALIVVATLISINLAPKSDPAPTLLRAIPKPDLSSPKAFGVSTAAIGKEVEAPPAR